MSDQLNLDQFLDSLNRGGEYVGTSEFTLNNLKAREKLSQHQLPDSGLWLVKMVQAAVALKASQIAIKFEKRKVTVQFDSHSGLKAGGLLSCVLSGELPAETALLHLVTGIRGATSSENEAMAWRCGGEMVTLDMSGSKLETCDSDQFFVFSCNRPSRNRSFSKILATSVSQLAKETMEEYDALQSRCWPCPIPIVVDGREIPRGYNVLKAGHVETSAWRIVQRHNEQGKTTNAILAVGGCPAQGTLPTLNFHRAVIAGSSPEVRSPVYKAGTFLQWPECEEPCRAAVVVERDYQAANCIDFVLDGAVVQRVPIPLIFEQVKVFGIKITTKDDSTKVRLVIPIEAHQVDISQFSVREVSILDLVRTCAPTFFAMADELLRRRSQLWYIPYSPTTAKAIGGVSSLSLAGGAIASQGALLLPIGVLGGLIYGINTVWWRAAVFAALENLREAFSDYIE